MRNDNTDMIALAMSMIIDLDLDASKFAIVKCQRMLQEPSPLLTQSYLAEVYVPF